MADLKLRFLIEALDKGAKGMVGGLAKAAGGLGSTAKAAASPVGRLAAAADKAGDKSETAAKKLVSFSAGAKLTQTAANQAWKPVQKLGEVEEKAGNQADRAGDQHERSGRQIKGAGLLALTAATALGGAIGALTANALGAVGALPGYILATSKRIASIRKEAAAVHLTTDQYQRLAYVFEANEIPAEKLGGVLQTLADKQLESLRGNKNAALAFRLVGVAVKDSHNKLKPTPALLGQIADRFDKLSAARQDFVSKQLGAGSAEELKRVLGLGSAGIQALGDQGVRDGNVLTEAQIAKAQELNDSYLKLRLQLAGLRDQVVVDTLPTFLPLVKAGAEWVRLNKEEIRGSIQRSVERIAAVDWERVGRGIGAIADLFDRIGRASERFDRGLDRLPFGLGGKKDGLFGIRNGGPQGLVKFAWNRLTDPVAPPALQAGRLDPNARQLTSPVQAKRPAVDVRIKVDQEGRVSGVTAKSDDDAGAAIWRGLAAPWG